MLDFVRTAQNPWSQEVLIGVAWDLMWAAIAVGALFAIGHAIWKATVAPSTSELYEHGGSTSVGETEHVQKYTATARVFHWLMAASMLTLLVTAFVPVIGIQFPWVTIHWIAGVALIALIVFHIFHSTIFLSFWSMWVDGSDFKNMGRFMKRLFGGEGKPLRREGKYAWPNKVFHHATALFGLAVMVTGAVMMFRIETPFFARDPYLFSDQAWGWIYVIHGISAVVFITMVMAHIYFGVARPEKYWMTRSMIKGWITGEEYEEHHDPDRWPVGEGAGQREPSRAPAGFEAAD